MTAFVKMQTDYKNAKNRRFSYSESSNYPGVKISDFGLRVFYSYIYRSGLRVKNYSILIITGVQASGVIIDRLLRQCCFLWSEIVGPHSSGNFND